MNTLPKSIVRTAARHALAATVLSGCVSVHAETYTAPRTPHGHPDLQGLWTNATLTPVERPTNLGDKLVLSEAGAAAMERQMAQMMEASAAPSR